MSYRDLEVVVYNDPEIGSGFAQIILNFLLNRLEVDLNGDGTPDNLSAAFEFTGVRATVDRESPCLE